ncbi:MAG: FecR family protein [Ferruginibacter sp.]|nr:FecR family protein [Ferruginibacter sp.]
MIKDRIWTLVSRKLSGEATTSELIELDDFVKARVNADLYLQAIDEYWKLVPEKDEEFLEATYQLHLGRLKENGFDLETGKEKDETHSLYFDNGGNLPKKSKSKKLLIAASLFSVFALLFFFRGYFENPLVIPLVEKIAQSEISTKTGSRTRIQLPDGSSVWLNGGSKLVYDNLRFGKVTREVTLAGEGYFDIIKNKDKPFVIHANRISIKVTGTAFNVKAYPGEKNTETSLIRGSIEVTMIGRKEKIMMKPNDKLIISDEKIPGAKGNSGTKKNGSIVAESTFMSLGHLTLANDENTVVETAWVENKLVFDKETFEEVALKMEKWYGVLIHFEKNKLKSQRLTGSFEKETIAEALRALQISTPFFKYKINNQHINIF